jgi:hypothetical protein
VPRYYLPTAAEWLWLRGFESPACHLSGSVRSDLRGHSGWEGPTPRGRAVSSSVAPSTIILQPLAVSLIRHGKNLLRRPRSEASRGDAGIGLPLIRRLTAPRATPRGS